MEMPLGKKATKKHQKQASTALAVALGFHPLQAHPDWLDGTIDSQSALLELMVKYNVWPRRNNPNPDIVIVQWGNLPEEAKIVPIHEHKTKLAATEFCIVLAITAFLHSEGSHDIDSKTNKSHH